MRKIILSIALLLSTHLVGAQVIGPSAGDIGLQVSNGMAGFNTRYIDTNKTGALNILMFGQDPTPGAPVGQLRAQKRVFGPSVVCGTATDSTCDVVSTGMTVYAAQVADSSPVGRSVMTASDASAARLAIGAGTSSFDGSYPSLTSVPTTFAPSPHTHPAAQISDATSAGRAILTAADASAIRSLINTQSIAEASAAYYPAATNPASYLTSVSNAQVLAAIGFTPLNQAGARTAISLTTTGIGAATYNSATGVINVPTAPTINRARITTAADGTYTWTLPVACGTGVTPVVSITPETPNPLPTGGTAADVYNHKITSLTNTTVSILVSRSQASVAALLGLTVLSVPAAVAPTPVHLIAICP